MPRNEGKTIPSNLTTAERDAIATPVLSEIIFNTTTNKLQNWDGSAWVDIDSGGGGGGSYFKAEVIVTTSSNNFKTSSPVNVPGLTYTITQDGDYVFYTLINGMLEKDKTIELFFAKNGTLISDTLAQTYWPKKKKDSSLQNTAPIDGLVIGDVITVQMDTDNQNFDLELRRILVQSWT
jgi:hypothetical protein